MIPLIRPLYDTVFAKDMTAVDEDWIWENILTHWAEQVLGQFILINVTNLSILVSKIFLLHWFTYFILLFILLKQFLKYNYLLIWIIIKIFLSKLEG